MRQDQQDEIHPGEGQVLNLGWKIHATRATEESRGVGRSGGGRGVLFVKSWKRCHCSKLETVSLLTNEAMVTRLRLGIPWNIARLLKRTSQSYIHRPAESSKARYQTRRYHRENRVRTAGQPTVWLCVCVRVCLQAPATRDFWGALHRDVGTHTPSRAGEETFTLTLSISVFNPRANVFV